MRSRLLLLLLLLLLPRPRWPPYRSGSPPLRSRRNRPRRRPLPPGFASSPWVQRACSGAGAPPPPRTRTPNPAGLFRRSAPPPPGPRARAAGRAPPRLPGLDPQTPRAAFLPALPPPGPFQGADRPRPLARRLYLPTTQQLPRHRLPPAPGTRGQGLDSIREGPLRLQPLACLLLRRRGLRGTPVRGPKTPLGITRASHPAPAKGRRSLQGRLPGGLGGGRMGDGAPRGALAGVRGGAAAPGRAAGRVGTEA